MSPAFGWQEWANLLVQSIKWQMDEGEGVCHPELKHINPRETLSSRLLSLPAKDITELHKRQFGGGLGGQRCDKLNRLAARLQ